MRAPLLLVLSLGCGSTPTSLRPVVLDDPDLETLAFLDGCWSARHADYGSRVCFWRERDGWTGTLRDDAPPLPSTEWGLRIVRDGSRAVALIIDPRSSGWDGSCVFLLTHASEDSVTFAAGDLTISFSRYGPRLVFSEPYDAEGDILDWMGDAGPP